MSDQPIHPDDVQLTEEESAADFTRYWTDDRIERAKLLAKKLLETGFDVVENDGLRATRKPESVVVVTPVRHEKRYSSGLPEPERPKLHLNMGTLTEDCIRVFRLTDNSHFPNKE